MKENKEGSKRQNKRRKENDLPKQKRQNKQKKTKNRSQGKHPGKLKVIPLGGLNEIGKNLTVLEYEDEIMIIDCGITFPDDEMYGIDVVLPDFSYLTETKKKIRGLVITHGHEDHIGGVPYLLQEINVPVYGTPLSLGLIKHKLDEHDMKGNLKVIHAGDKIRLGKFKVNAIRTTHSIADSICLHIETPVGNIFHTGDFKIDYTPVDGDPIDLGKFAEVGKKGVLLLMSDSTNAVRPGFTQSERIVGNTLKEIIRGSKSRIIIATFSSNVHRIAKIMETAKSFRRKVAVSGRSMETVVSLAIELGYIKLPANTLIDINDAKNYPDKNLIIITTGSQGEPMSALSRMANDNHRSIKIKPGDQVVLSSTPIPGNEKLVSNVVNKLSEKGAEVIYSDIADTHVSGHACQEELKLVQALIKPKFFMPVHGEFRHLMAHEKIAADLGTPKKNIFKLNNGDCLTLTPKTATLTREYCPAGEVMVDGLGVGDIGNVVLRDRRLLSESGLITVVVSIDHNTNEIVAGPDIISRGFVYIKESGDLLAGMKRVAERSLDRMISSGETDWNDMKNGLRDDLRRYIFEHTERQPMIMPIFMDV